MSTLMMPAATMTTMTNTAPIAVTQPKSDPAKMAGMINNNRQGKPKQSMILYDYVGHAPICVSTTK